MAAEGVSNTEAMATLPLEKVLEMQKMIDAASEEVEVEPPVAATVNRIELSGRLLEGAIEFNAHYDIEVLSNGSWVEVPLLEQDAQTHLLKLPKVADASFAVIDGNLHFISKKRKRYQFDLSILKEASIEGKNRSLRIQLADSSVSICKLTFDEDLFELSNTRVLAKPDGVLVFPTDGAFSIGWVVAEGAVVSEEREKPEIASVIPAAYASSVSTLEGMRITRLLYQLRFAGRKTIEFEIPEHQKVERAFLNGFAVPVEMVGRQLQIEAAPARAGDESATIELVLTKSEGVFHLAGNIALSLPKTSWPMNEIFLDLHLPDVFNYQWKGGSLSPVKSRAMPAFTYRVPLPGKKMSFHQYLVTTHAPQVGLEYAVDLKDQYFCAGETSRTARVQSVEVPVRSSREVY
jgi:hypothetical protein